MPITFADQLLAQLATEANRAPFLAAIGLGGWVGSSFAGRYGVDGYQVDAVALGPIREFTFQRPVLDDPRLTGTKTGGTTARVDYRLHRQELLGWVDVSFSVPAQLSLHAVPGTLQLGPDADVRDEGDDVPVALPGHRLKLSVPVGTDAFQLDYLLDVFVFVAEEPAPVQDLRRIAGLRGFLEADPRFLVSLDAPDGQRPYAFVQVYPTTAPNPLPPSAVTGLFAAADVLAAFVAPPA